MDLNWKVFFPRSLNMGKIRYVVPLKKILIPDSISAPRKIEKALFDSLFWRSVIIKV